MLTFLALAALQTCGYSDYHCPSTGYTSYEAPAESYTTYPHVTLHTRAQAQEPLGSGYRVGVYGIAARAVGCVAIDGDTIKCTSTSVGGFSHLRLDGIDAPELPGHCRAYRVCAPGDPYAAKAALSRLLHGVVRYDYLGLDKYTRQIALAKVGNTNLSCYMVTNGYAIYKPTWDNRKALWNTCSYIRQHYSLSSSGERGE